MEPRHLRLVWGTPPVPAGRWHAGLLNLKSTPAATTAAGTKPVATDTTADPWFHYRRHRPHLSLRGLLLWFLGFALIAWLCGAALLQHRLARAHPFNRVTFLDLALPHRWAGLKILRGQADIDQGRALLSEGRFGEGFGLLRRGLAQNPTDSEARLDLARIHVALRLASRASQLLREGLAHGYPGRDYLEFALALAADADAPQIPVELCALARARLDALPADSRPAGDSFWLDQQQVRALFAATRHDEALALVERAYPEQHPFRREITIVHRLETSRPREAATLAAAWTEAEPRAPEPLRLLARAYREAGDAAGLTRTLTDLRALDPASPEPLLYALVQLGLAGLATEARSTLDTILLRHGANPALYPALAEVLVKLGDHDPLERLEFELRERGLPLRAVHLARLQLASAAHDWPSLLRHAETLRAAPGPALSPAQEAWLETSTRLARACLDASSGTQAALVEHVADHPGTLRLYTLLLEALLAGGRPETARQLLTLAEGPYPDSVTLAAVRPRLDAALAAALPAPEAPAAGPADHLASAEALAAACAERIAAADTEGALALLTSARRARPDWLPAAEARLDALELPLRARGDDPLRLRFLARSALAREPRAADDLLALAVEIDADQPHLRAHAVLLVREILRQRPDHAEALAQLALWEPAPTAAPLDVAAP